MERDQIKFQLTVRLIDAGITDAKVINKAVKKLYSNIVKEPIYKKGKLTN